ncbi:MAG: S41 family peptidase [Candidatus Omnitrophota bacterium]
MRRRIIIFMAIVFTGAFVLRSFALSDIDKKKKDELYRQVKLFSDTIVLIQTDYVQEAKPKDLIYGALKGMLGSLDPHSQFLDPDTYNELKVDTEGKFGGIGIEITIKDGLLTVVSPIEDTPGWIAGIKANDRIVKINDELTRDMTLTDAVKKMRGKPGTTVDVIVFRESEKKIFEFKITRGVIKIKEVKDARILEDGIGYIRVVEFSDNTQPELANALRNLSKENMNALIIDLRNNPGGLLDMAVKVTENFIQAGKLVVYTSGRREAQNYRFISRAKAPILEIPMVVLINEGSASGSEIVAGALQDYKRAIIVGTKSFGKGSVQTVIPLGDGSALRLTTAKYFTPLGREIQDKGVTPDIVVEEGKIEIKDKKGVDINKPQEIFDELVKDKQKEDKSKEYKKDNQLMRAVDILKALKIVSFNNNEKAK